MEARVEALFATEELSMPEKFRPYRLPPDDWLRRVGGRIGGATPADAPVARAPG